VIKYLWACKKSDFRWGRKKFKIKACAILKNAAYLAVREILKNRA